MSGLNRDMAISLLFGAVFLLTLAEIGFSYYHDKKYYEAKDTWTNVYLMSVTFVINLAVKTGSFLFFDYLYKFRLFAIHNVFVYWVVLIVAVDFLYWLVHSLGHFSRFFWAIHVTHHSSEHFNLSTGFRSTVFEPLYRMLFFAPLALMGFSAIDILFGYLITQVYGNFVHTRAVGKLHPLIEYIFVTPSHHRVHHAMNTQYLDRNMGMFLIIWDRLFGTFQNELDSIEIRYGLTKQPDSQGPVTIIFHEFIALSDDVRKAPTFTDKLKYTFYPPGWSHDGSTKTTRQLRLESTEGEKN